MFDFMFQVVNVLKSQGKSVAVLFLSYGNTHAINALPD